MQNDTSKTAFGHPRWSEGRRAAVVSFGLLRFALNDARNDRHGRRLFPLIALLMAGLFLSRAAAEPGEARALIVSEGLVGGNDRSSRDAADDFAERVELGREFSAERGLACLWHAAPEGVPAENHVSVVELRFGNRLELLAFMFGKDGAVTLAARAPALYQERPWFPSRASPGDSQWPENAPADLVARFALAVERPPEDRGEYQLVVQDWEQEPVALSGDLLHGGAPSPMQAGAPRIAPLAAAAMYAGGFRACMGAREDTIVLNIRMGELDCAVHAVLRRGDRVVYELERHGIPYEGLHDALRIVFLNLLEWRGTVADWFRAGDGFTPLRVMELDDAGGLLEDRKTVLIGSDRGGLSAVAVAAGERLWSVPFDDGVSDASRDGSLLLRKGSRLTLLSAAGEARFSFSTGDPEQASVYGELCADALYRELRVLERGDEKWSKVLPRSVLAGPRLTAEGVLVGDAAGELRYFAIDGSERWTLALPRPVRGELYAAGGLFFGVDEAGVLYAVDPRGTLVWQAAVGDVLTGAPEAAGDTLFVGSKSGRVFAFDRGSGKCLQKREFGTWLLGCRLCGSSLLCVTLDKKLHLLDAATFEPERALRFPFALGSRMLPVRDFQRRQASGSAGGLETVSGCLLSDVKGHVFLVSVAAEPEGRP